MGRAEAGVASEEDGTAALRTRRLHSSATKSRRANGTKDASRHPKQLVPPLPPLPHTSVFTGSRLHFAGEDVAVSAVIRIHYGRLQPRL